MLLDPCASRELARAALGEHLKFMLNIISVGSLSFARRFLPPWSVEETEPCCIVSDANGHALAYAGTALGVGAASPSITAKVKARICSPATTPGASPPTWPSCRSC